MILNCQKSKQIQIALINMIIAQIQSLQICSGIRQEPQLLRVKGSISFSVYLIHYSNTRQISFVFFNLHYAHHC